MAGYGDFDAERIKHMEMIQAVVTRMAGNSFLIKGWAITLSGAFLGFAVTRKDSDLAFASLLPILVFWGLDTYYLRSERLFRAFYDQVRQLDPKVEAFAMGATGKFKRRVLKGDTTAPTSHGSALRTTLRPTLSVFYCALLAATGLVIWAIQTGTASREDSALLDGAKDLADVTWTALSDAAGRIADAIGNAFHIYSG